MNKRLVVSVLALFLLVQLDECAAGDWTGWLGPQRNGFVADVTLPATLPDQLTAVWTENVGTGYGSPLVVGDRVFQHARQAENEVLLCLSLQQGVTIWRQQISVPFRVRGGGEFHGKGPKSCPVYADGRIFTMSITGRLHAWSAETGQPLWQAGYRGPSDDQSSSAARHPHWGASCSPIVFQDKVLIHFGDDTAGELVALDAATGRRIWTNGTAGASYSSPLVGTLEGVTQVVEWNHEVLTGVDVETGQTLWSTPFPHEEHNQNMPTPSLWNGRVLLGAENRGLHCFEPQKQGDQWSVHKIWSQPRVGLDMSSAVVCNDLLFGMSHFGRGRLFCVDPVDGRILWQGDGRFGSNATFLTTQDQVVVLNDSGRLQVLAADGGEMTSLAAWQVSDRPTWAPPVLLPDGLLIKDRDRLLRLTF